MADDVSTPQQGPRFRGVATLEGTETSDRRIIGLNETTWRELPLTLMVMTKASHGGAPSTETVPGGAIDVMERRSTGEGAAEIYFEGWFDTSDVGVDTARLVGNKVMRGVSIDFTADEELEVTEEDEEGYPIDYLVHYSNVEIGMATVCPFPAFAGGYLELAEDVEPATDEEVAAATARIDVAAAKDLPGLHPTECRECSERSGIVASGGPLEPPLAWFEDPKLDGPTALTITDDGRVYGHLATWNECHVGVSGQCVTPPRSATNYARFRYGATRTAEGRDVATGRLFMGTPHAPVRPGMSVSVVQDHYANTGTATAHVAAGEDQWGVWVAGAMRPGLTPEQVYDARGSVLSGDWRSHGGRLELVAALHVNVPGFGVKRAQLVASGGQPEALVAAGASAAAVLARKQRQAGDAGVERLVRDSIREELSRALRPLFAPQVDAARAAARQVVAGSVEARRQAARDRVRRK